MEKENNKKNGFTDSIISGLLFLFIFVPYVILGVSSLLIDIFNNGMCFMDSFMNIFFWGCIVFIPILCCYFLGKIAIKEYNEFGEKKSLLREKFNFLNLVSLFLIKMFSLLYFLLFLFLQFSC